MAAESHTTLTQFSPILTNEFLDRKLTDWFGKPVHFTHWEYVGETGKGDSFLSDLIRIKIFGEDANGQQEHVQIILKTIPKSKARRLTYRLDQFFRNEILFYEKVLPELLKFQSKKNPKQPFDNYPKLFASYINGIDDVLALEDASLLNYGSPVRQEGIDIEHCKVTLKCFAKFHAISFAMKDQEPKAFDQMKDHLFETYYATHLWSWYERFFKTICCIAIDCVEKEYPDSIYLKKIKEFATPAIYEKMVDAACNTLKNGVISHGDSWTNNFLFKYDVPSVPSDAIMLDFQLARCATPVLDISFFIYACTTQDLRDDKYDWLLNYYYEILAGQIEDLGSDPGKVYPREEFEREIKKYSFFGVAFSLESTPFIVLDPSDAPDMTFEGDGMLNIADVWNIKPLKTQKARLREANNIVDAVNRGYI